MDKKILENWIRETLDTWNNSDWAGKIWWCFAFIGASTTLTTLSGTIVEWKGLIADMLYFYSQYIRDPIVAIVRFITFDYIRPNGPAIDALLLYLIYFSAEKRAIGKLSERSALNSSMFIAAVIALPMILLSLLLLVLYLIDRHLIPGVWHYAESIVIFIPLVLILWSLYQWIRYLNWLAKGNRPEGLVPESQSVLYKIAVRQFVQFATPILAAFLALVLLASINSGFS